MANIGNSSFAGQTALVTGGANGIGAAIVQAYSHRKANVVIADLSSTITSANALISSLPHPDQAIFVPVDITDWTSMTRLFRMASDRFGNIDIVVANAGIMETKPFFDFEVEVGTGELREDSGAGRVVDINLKGTMNTLRLAMFHMKSNSAQKDWPGTPPDSSSPRTPQARTRGSIVLVSSTSGFFGGTSVVSYIASKHGVIGLLRASQAAAQKYGVQVNAVAPFITPTFITEGYSAKYRQRGLPLNTSEDVAEMVVRASLVQRNEENGSGKCFLVAGGMAREIEGPRNSAIASYMGEDVKRALDEAKLFFEELGGYPLPKARV